MASYKQNSKPKELFVNPQVMVKLHDMFGLYLHPDIIRSVAYNCNSQLDMACNILAGLTNNVNQNRPLLKKRNTNHANINSVAYMEDGDSDADVIIENECRGPSSTSNVNWGLPAAISLKKAVPKPKKVVQKKPPNKSKKEIEYEQIRDSILTGAKVLVILRGVPGSGKSHLAKQLVESTVGKDNKKFIFSTDDFFTTKNNRYMYNPMKLSEAHVVNQQKTLGAMRAGVSPIIIDNTNTQIWEMKVYAEFAIEHCYFIEILEPLTPWIFNLPELTRRNIHNVPFDKIRDMLARYEKNITAKSLLQTFRLQYKVGRVPPEPRMYPPIKHISGTAQPIQKLSDVKISLPQLQKVKRKKKCSKTSDGKFVFVKSESAENLVEISNVNSQNNDGFVNLYKFDSCNDLNNACKDYVLVMPDNSLKFQKNQTETENDDNDVDLISFDENDATMSNSNSETTTDGNIDALFDLLSMSNNNEESSADEENSENNVAPFDLTSWGTSTSALKSWDIVDKTFNKQTNIDNDSILPKSQRENFTRTTTKDKFTNTSSLYFNLTYNSSERETNIKILPTSSRNINENYVNTPLSPPKILMLDKGTVTGHFEPETNETDEFNELKMLFPHVKDTDLRELYEKCDKNVNWTVDLLLDSSMVEVNVPEVVLDNKETQEHIPEMSDQLKNIPQSIRRKPTKKSKEIQIKEMEMLKQTIYNKICIASSHYTENLLNIRKKRHGESIVPLNSDITQNVEVTETLDVTQESEDFEDEISEEETLEMNFGNDFVRQLEENFGCADLSYPDGFQPVVQLPSSIARQLHAYWLESVYQQMENQSSIIEKMVKEDEEFARKLQQMDSNDLSNEQKRQSPNLQEIMDMEIALEIYRMDQEQWKKETPDDMATRMKRQKLFSEFPDLDQDILNEILQAHDNSFDQTVEVLCASTGKILEKLDCEGKQKKLIEKVKNEATQSLDAPGPSGSKPERSVLLDEADPITKQKNANFYRDLAAHHLKMRGQLYQQAQSAFQKGSAQIASYYSEMAKLHAQKYEVANSQAATAFIAMHSVNTNSKTLDLHFLYVKEAEQALSVFIDDHISKLNENNKQHDSLFIITGRGQHSRGGVSQIKPVVKKKLKLRKLKFVEMNPGLLKVIITRHSILTNSLKK